MHRANNKVTMNMTTGHHDADGDDDEGAEEGHYIFFDKKKTILH
jgi:hypothetical protein